VKHVLTFDQDKIKILLAENPSERDVLYAYVHGYFFRQLHRDSKNASPDLPDIASNALKRADAVF